MNDDVPGNKPLFAPTKRGRPAGGRSGSFKNTNVFKQLMYAKNDLALKLVETCQDRWPQIIDVLMDKVMEGDMRAMALLLDYAIEKAPQKFQISTNTMDISSMSMDDMMRLVLTYDSMIKEKDKTILGEAEEIESHSINSPPPPPEFSSAELAPNSEIKSAEDKVIAQPICEPIVVSENKKEFHGLADIDDEQG